LSQLDTPIRKCRQCGKEACNEEELELFVKAHTQIGRDNLCKSCFNKWQKERKKTDDRYYLKDKFNDIRGRCYNPNRKDYHLYGARGINICDEWLNNPESFVEWALSSEWKRGLEIDRIDCDGSYSPENCRWVTPLKQSRNRRNTVTFPDKGTRICCRCKVEKPLTEFSKDRSGRRYDCNECRRKPPTRGHELVHFIVPPKSRCEE